MRLESVYFMNADDSKQDAEYEHLFKKNQRELVLSKLSEAIDFLHNRAMKNRVYDPKNETVRINWFKALAYCCNVYNTISRDSDIDEIKNEIEDLKKLME